MTTRILIIGGVAAGASAAVKARRTSENAEIAILEKGPCVSYANCGLPYHLGGIIQKREALLLHSPKSLYQRFNVQIHVRTEARLIDSRNKIVTAAGPESEKEFFYDKLILANGAKSIVPPIKGIENVRCFSMHTVADVDEIKDFIEHRHPRSAVIIGAGYIGIEIAEALYHCNIKTTLVEATPTILPLFAPEMSFDIQKQIQKAGIDILTGALVTEATQTDNSIGLQLKDGTRLTTDMLFLCTGVRPNTDLAETAGIRLGAAGGVLTNPRMETSVEDIYAGGDLVEKVNLITGKNMLLPLAGPANREGRVAGCNAGGGDMFFKGVLGTSIVGFNGHCAARTGLSFKEALEAGFEADCVYTEDAHHARYFPDPRLIFLQTVYDKASGKILGAAASGSLGVERRIDILSTAIYAGLTVRDLEQMEFCYAPPYGAAKDNVNIAGFVASNQLRHTGFGIKPDDFFRNYRRGAKFTLLDVRTPREYEKKRLDGAVHINVNELRGRLDELNREEPIYVYCAVGYRGYLATRILRHNGFEAYNILGGIGSVSRFSDIS